MNKKEDSEDEMAFLDRVIEENSTCSFDTCSVEVQRAYYCQCRKCKKAFCAEHVKPHNHTCGPLDVSDSQFGSGFGFASDVSYAQKASNQTKAKAKSVLQELQAQRTAKPSQAQQNQN